jgi:hypothetical protein
VTKNFFTKKLPWSPLLFLEKAVEIHKKAVEIHRKAAAIHIQPNPNKLVVHLF